MLNDFADRSRWPWVKYMVFVTCVSLLLPANVFLLTGLAQPPGAGQDATKIPDDQLDSLVAPIALYPDPLLSQTLVASTYPLELVQLQQWLGKHQGLKDQALVDAVSKQPWDPSIQAMAALPTVVKRLVDDIQWTTDLGNAFLAQQSDVMDSVQRMRKKAQETGNLKSGRQQKVETKVVESRTVIVVEPADPQVVYVPSYSPAVVYGPPVYPYPPIYYPPTGAYVAGMAISFGVGLAVGAAWGGGWGWNCGWGHNDININRNNNFNRTTNIGNIGNRTNISGNRGGNSWRHNPQHRGGAPYRDRATANRFGGTARGDSLTNRRSNARQQIDRQGGNLRSNREGGTRGGLGDRAGDRAGDRTGSRGLTDRAGGGGDRVGNREVQRGSGGRDRGAFGGDGGFNGGRARANSNRGSSSFGGSRGGGSRGGGFSRGGGGGRRR